MRHRFLAMSFTLFSFCVNSYAAGPHVHGTARMQIAIDGNNVEVALISPLENLLGFERAPRNDKERQAVKKMMEKLNNPTALLVPTVSAQCTPSKPEINAPTLDEKKKSHNHGKHDEEHGELEAIVLFHCAVPSALTSMKVRLFDAFPRLKTLQAEVAAPGKQSAASLKRDHRILSW